jgi:2-succinyl-5-enolpyruvyl-6-hydroxy-3-cyclohexene-1-carboxylate synthase
MTIAARTGVWAASPAPALVTTQWARVLLDGLAASGVRDVVVSPGSRSTPLVAAALADERLRCRWVIDERSAGFFGLGIAKATERPVLMICTSGTAGAHYLPALLEARYAHASLILATADRPPELQRCGANQTIDQRSLFGDVVTWDLGLPDPSMRALRGLRRAAAQAVHAATTPPGPVHLNVPFRKPLEPVVANPAERAWVTEVDRLLAPPITRAPAPSVVVSSDALDEIGRAHV